MAEEAIVFEPQQEDDNRSSNRFWTAELHASAKMLEKYHTQATKVVDRFLGKHQEENDSTFSLNLFYANTKTLMDMLYSYLPKVEASRTFHDSADDVARVASDMIERHINLDIANNGEEYNSVLRSVLQDRLLPGLGVARVRYEVETETIDLDPFMDEMGILREATSVERVVSESAPVDYYHWQDVLWGWGRSFAELPWIAFRSFLNKKEVERRFGAEFVDELEYRKQKVAEAADAQFESSEDASPHQKAEVWEIWDRVSRKVRWYGKGAKTLLDEKDDPLQLSGFFPCPPFLIANTTTSLYRPVPDYVLAQDLYLELDNLQTRISMITAAVKVVGVYDVSEEGIKRMLQEGVENDLIPVDNWAMFAEKGGLKGTIDWFPLQDVAATLQNLIKLRDDTLRLLQQVTGMADLMLGQLNSPYEGVGQSNLKAQFSSVRVQALQDSFARFAGDLMQLKAEVICKHFEPETIVQNANMQSSVDAELIGPAVQLLKQPNMANIRVMVRPETVAMVDYARLKSERVEFLTALATFMQSAAPMLDGQPEAMPYLLKMLQWTMAGFKGSQEIEGVMDKAIEGAIAKLQNQQGQPDPEQEKEQAKLQGELQKIQAKSQADMQLRQADAQADLMQVKATHEAKMAEIIGTHQARMKEILTKHQADLIKEQAALEGDLAQTGATAEAEVVKDGASAEIELAKKAGEAEIELAKEADKTGMEIMKIGAQSAAKIDEIMQSQKGNDDGEKELDSD